MIKIRTLLIALFVASLLIMPLGCTGEVTTKEFNFSDFTKVNIGPAFKVKITQASSYNINITANSEKIEYIEVTKVGDTLNIGIESQSGPWNFHTLEAIITMPDIYDLDLSGASNGIIQGFSFSHDFSAELSGASRLSGDLTAGDVNFVLSGASNVELQGSANDMLAKVSGASRVKLGGFEVDNADVSLSGASNCTVRLDGTLSADVSGASKLTYKGNPTLGSLSSSGGSTIKKG
ncbi:head GIN domain-containing protein [Chloroflexota bacterium]